MLAQVFRRRLLDWYLPAGLALAAAAILTTGFGLALTGRFGQPLAPMQARAAAAPRGGAFRIVALGDSITDGTGDPIGRGYASRVSEALRKNRRIVIFTNLAVGGAETEDVLAVMNKGEAARQIAEADLILLSAGGNDLSHSLRAITGEPDREPELALSRAKENLAAILARLRAAAPQASIRLLGLYNPFEITPGDAPRARAQLYEWNAVIEQATHPYDDVLVVPVADIFAGRPDRLAGDRYHPGPRGHALMADRVLSTLAD
jgi:lysophospholipase L1-like esterase